MSNNITVTDVISASDQVSKKSIFLCLTQSLDSLLLNFPWVMSADQVSLVYTPTSTAVTGVMRP